jgi:hypothetical protein
LEDEEMSSRKVYPSGFVLTYGRRTEKEAYELQKKMSGERAFTPAAAAQPPQPAPEPRSRNHRRQKLAARKRSDSLAPVILAPLEIGGGTCRVSSMPW